MNKRTPFYERHCQANAKIVDFAGWDMPLHYGSQLNEHKIVRDAAGVFDVSHMGIVDVTGDDAHAYLQYLLANDVAKLNPGKALYTCMLNEQGGILDDLIVYQLNPDYYRIVVNASTRDKDFHWMQAHQMHFNVTSKTRADLCMLAIQGPNVREKIPQLFDTHVSTIMALKPFTFIEFDHWQVTCTGYTGEDGFEIIFPTQYAHAFWDRVLACKIEPCGLGARDTLRLEAGLNLYGSDMDETVNPFESNLGWTVAMTSHREFIGKDALMQAEKQSIPTKLVGLVLTGPGIMRHGQRVMTSNGEGFVTSGGYAPTLEKSIGLARIPQTSDESCFVEIRQKSIPAKIVKPPFVKHGKKLVMVQA